MEKLSYSIPGASDATDISQTKIRQAIGDGLISTFRVGRSVRISDPALRGFIEQLETGAIEMPRQHYKNGG